MGYYIIQSDEREIDFGLFDKLAGILTIETGMPRMDARIKMKHFHGMLSVPDKEQARKVSEHFQRLGLDNFILEEDELVELPPMEPFSEGCLETIGTPELVAAGRVSKEIAETITRFNPLKVKYTYMGSAIRNLRLIPSSGIEKRVRRKRQTKYYVDMFTQYRHWRIARESTPLREIEPLERFAIPGVYLTQSVREMLQGRSDIISFSEERYYGKYLTWLIQLKYAKPE